MSKYINWENIFTYDTLVHAISGAAGGVTATTVFYPLDTIRSRLQVEESNEKRNLVTLFRDLIKEEGFESLYRGMYPVLQSLCCSNFVYFYTFHGLRSLRSTSSQSYMGDLSIGAIAGIINVLLTTPMWVVNTRIKMQGAKLRGSSKDSFPEYNYKGIWDGLVKISEEEGIASLWSGTLPSLLLVCNPSIHFMVYETLKRHALKNTSGIGMTGYFLIGAIAKCVATVTTYPLQLIQSKLRYGSKRLGDLNLLQILVYILGTKGPKGLYKGLEAKLLQTVLTAALMFAFYEKISSFVFSLLKSTPKKH